MYLFFFFFKQKTAYDMRISDWSSDVCSSDLTTIFDHRDGEAGMGSADIDGYDVALLRMCCRHDGTGAHRSAPASIAEAPCSASLAPTRSEERRVGKECVSTCRSRWSRYLYKKTTPIQ